MLVFLPTSPLARSRLGGHWQGAQSSAAHLPGLLDGEATADLPLPAAKMLRGPPWRKRHCWQWEAERESRKSGVRVCPFFPRSQHG